MFSANKPTGFASPFTGGSSTSTGFSTPGFGASTPQTGGLFGQANTSTSGGLFGGGSSAFGQQSSGFGFGSTPSASGGLFGQKTTASTGLFGTTPSTGTSSGFGFGQSGGGLFGTSTNTAGGGLFGQSGTAGAFGQQNGTTTKFDPPTGQDTMVKNGVTTNISTKHQCITAMKQYEAKSLEELRVEDYTANRKGKQQSGTGFGFGTQTAPATQTTGFGTAGFGTSGGFGTPGAGFGTNTSTGTGLFGQQAPAQASTGGLFGSQNKPLFGTATTTQSGFGFGTNTSTGTGGLFGNQNKPLFGTPATSTQSSLFGNTGTSTFGQAASTGFGGFGTSQSGGLFANKPAFGTQTTASTGFNFGGTNTSTNLFAKPFSAPSAGFGFNTPTQSTGFGTAQPFAQNKTGFGLASTTTPSFNFGSGGLNTGTSLFNNNLSKPAGFGNLGTTNTGFGGFNATNTLNPGANTALGNQQANVGNDNSALLQQTLLALTHSPYGDSPLFMNMKESSTKREDVLKPTNPAAQKAVFANQHKVSPRPVSKIRPKALHGRLSGGKAQIFEGLEDDDFSFGNETFQPRKSVKKLTIKKSGHESGTPSRATSLSGEPPNLSSLRDDEQGLGRASPVLISTERNDNTVPVSIPESENIIRSKGISPALDETSNRGTSNMDDTIAMLNERNKNQEPVQTPNMPEETQVNISIISRDDSTLDESVFNERPMTPPPPHPAGIVLTRPDYYTIPNVEALGDMVDENGNCYVENFSIGRENYGSIYFPGITNITNMNFDEIVYIRRKEVIVYADDKNKPAVGDGLNKRAEITLDYVWPRDKSVGTLIKSPEKLQAMNWNDKVEQYTAKIGAKFIEFRPESGSWVFEVKHFSKYGLYDDLEEEEISEQDKKRLKTGQQQQQQTAQKGQEGQVQKDSGPAKPRVPPNGQIAKFSIGTDDESEASSVRQEIPMGDDDQPIEMSQGRQREERIEFDEEEDGMEIREELPSSHRLATSMRVDAKSMQNMKASFFGEEDVPGSMIGQMFGQRNTTEEEGSPYLRHGEGKRQTLFSSAMKSSYMAPVKLSNMPQSETVNERALFSPRLITPEPKRAVQPTFQPPIKEHLLLASGMTQQDIPKKLVGSKISRTIPHVRESYMYGKQNLLVDAGLLMGRSFRVGWGPGWTLAHSGDIVQPGETEERPTNNFNLFLGTQRRNTQQGTNSWTVQLQKLNIADHIHPMDKSIIQNHCEMLEIQLVHSESTTESDCPVFTPSLGVEALHQYAEQNQVELDNLRSHPDESTVQHMGMVWDLCVALWGNLPELEDTDAGRDSYLYQNSRREAVSRWLSAVSGQIIGREVQENKYKDQGHLQAIISSLTGNQIKEACQIAQDAGDHKLALLLCQAMGCFMPRQLVNKQLDEWIELGVDNFINELRMKIYSLLSGQLVLTCPNLTINTCEDLDWKRSFALHLWFYCQADSPIQEAVEIFDRAYQGSMDYSSYTTPPLPPYLEGKVWDMTERENQIKDTCYHLLCLYCQKQHMLEEILNPVTSTVNQLDYRLSWHLSQVLQSLTYKRMSPYHRACLHMNFAAHLESLNLWEWAVFVALHIENPINRESAVKNILSRHVQLTEDEDYMEKEELLREKLMVPRSWIHHAKAIRANFENRHEEEAWHLLKSGHWNKSHEIVLKYIAPDAIIHEKYEDLKQYLSELAVPGHSSTIIDWHIGGKVYLDYINICEAIQQLSREEEPSPYELDRLLPEVKSLCTKVNSIPCRDSKDRLCQSEMAKKAANLLRVILTLQCQARGETQPPIRLLAPNISNLPMPEDYTLQELRALNRSYMMEQAVQ